jgi:hypothetical protein
MVDCLPRFHKQSVQKGFPQCQISGSTNLTGTISREAMHQEKFVYMIIMSSTVTIWGEIIKLLLISVSVSHTFPIFEDHQRGPVGPVPVGKNTRLQRPARKLEMLFFRIFP